MGIAFKPQIRARWSGGGRIGCLRDVLARNRRPPDHTLPRIIAVALGGDAEDRYHRGMIFVDRIARIRIELDGIDPSIWRRIEVPLTTSLKGLHEIIQAVMLFENYHLFRFEVGDKLYGIPDPEWDHGPAILEAKNIQLGALVEHDVGTFSYTYDFGDNWQHYVTIEVVIPADPAIDYPRFVDRARRAPPEDVGGIPGFEEFLLAMTKPRHLERRRLTAWYGRTFDPADIDLPTIKARIGKLRTLGVAGYAKSRRSMQ